MARKKVTLAWIANPAARSATLSKRRKGLLKKVAELSTLCAVPACAVVYEPHMARPEVWPSESKAKEILRHFKSLPEVEQTKRRVDQEGFLRHSILKISDQVKRQQRENRQLEMAVLLNQVIAGRGLTDVGFEDAVLLKQLVEEKAQDVKDKLAEMRASQTKAKEELTSMMMMQSLMNFNPNPNPNHNPSTSCMKEEKTVLGFYGGGGGHLDDVFMQQQCHDPCIGFRSSLSAWNAEDPCIGFRSSSSAWNAEDSSFIYGETNLF